MPTIDRDRADIFALTLPDPHGSVEVMRAWYRKQVFPRHHHPYYTVGIMRRGVGTLRCGRATLTLHPGDVIVIAPGDVHTGASGSARETLVYTAMHVPADLLAGASISSGVIPEPRVAAELARVDEAIASRDNEAAATAAMAAIDRLALDARGRAGDERRAVPPFVRLVTDAIDDAFADADRTSLQSLAVVAGVSPFHLVREFGRAVGMSPHQYLLQTRVRRARELLARFERISDVAATVGFADQSHLTAHFRRHFGITPAVYQRGLGVSRPS